MLRSTEKKGKEEEEAAEQQAIGRAVIMWEVPARWHLVLEAIPAAVHHEC